MVYLRAMKLQDFLSAKKLTITAFSRMSGVPRTTIYEIMEGKGTTASTAYKVMAAAPGVELVDLVGDRAAAQISQR